MGWMGLYTVKTVVDSNPLQEVPFVAKAEVLGHWSHGHSNPTPPHALCFPLPEWDSPRVKAAAQSLIEDAPNAISCARSWLPADQSWGLS